MKEVTIEYNPYRLETKYYIDGKEVVNGKLFNKRNVRLQAVLSPSENWDGLPAEISKACNSKEINIKFKGRSIDFDDLRLSIEASSLQIRFSVEHSQQKEDEVIDAALEKLMKDVKESGIGAFNEKDENGNTIFDEYEEYQNGEFTVNVIATMSSGKSTLINALLYTDLLPSKNEACTATVTRIIDKDGSKGFFATCYDSSGEKEVYKRSALTSEKMREFNEDKGVSFIDVEGDIPAISSEKIKLVLRDTPGPNNSRNENHERLTRSIIRDPHGIVLYVINATQIGINDDQQLLKDIADEMKKNGKESSDRFIFVINKCDQLDEEKETVETIIANTRKYLHEVADIENATIVPMSALTALIIRKKQRGAELHRIEQGIFDSRGEFINYGCLHFEKYADLSPSVARKIEQILAVAESRGEAGIDQTVLVHTGIVVLEEMIAEYIDKYAYPMKICDATEGMISVLKQLKMEERFFMTIQENTEKLKSVRSSIEKARKQRDNGEKVLEEFKERIGKFKVDDRSRAKVKKTAEKEINRLVNKRQGREEISKEEAKRAVDGIKHILNQYQRNAKQEIIRSIQEEVINKGKQIMSEYQGAIRKELKNVEIEGYKWEDVSFKFSYDFEKVDVLLKHHQTTTTKYERQKVGEKRNPEREGFFGLFKFWEDWMIPVYDSVAVGRETTVKISAVINDILGPFYDAFYTNIDNVYDSAKKQVEDYKKIFTKNLEAAMNEINKVVDRLHRETEEEGKLKEMVETLKEQKTKVDSIQERLSTILD